MTAEVRLKPVKFDDIPGMHTERPHDDWARAAIKEFSGSGYGAAEVEVPEFRVKYTTVVNLLRKYGGMLGVGVKVVKASTPPTHFRTFLYRRSN